MTDDARPTPLEVRILSQRSRGLLVGLLDGSETGWLPCNEWSYDAEAWRADSALVLTGTLLKVVPWDQTLTSGLRAYSRRRVAHDPWRLVTQAWIGEYRQFTVTGLTREFATGEIEPGLQARVRRNAFRSLGVEGVQGLSEAELGHSVISIGDTVAGLVSEIAFPEESTRPSLCLDPRQLLARLATDPAMLLPAASEPRSALLAGLKDAASVRTPPPLELIWVIDDDQEFREATAAYLRSLGYTVFAAPSGADIVALEKEPSTDPDLIIIDVHLTEDSANHDGLQLAAELSKRLPRAKLLVVSGEDSLTPRSGITERKIREYGTLLVGGYLPKPFTVDELETYISDATSRPRRRFADCLSATIPSVAKAQATVPIIQASPGRARPARFSIEDALRDLHSYSEKSSFHLFEMNPLNGRGRSLAHVGDPHPWQVVAHKLQKSSVRDTAIDPERAEWYDEDIHASPGLQRKHFWLLQARQYRSAMGIPVETASPEGHCLLGFNPAPKGISASLSHAARLCAERLARAIEWQRLQRQSSERASYEKAGMAFAFLAHELGADLSAIDMTVSTLSRALDARPGNAQDVMPATVSRLKGMSHDAVEKMQLLLWRRTMGTTGETRVLLCAKDAIKAARQHVPLDFAIDFALHSEDSDDLSVRTSRAVLTLALFNLLLNALQQIALFRLRPGRVLLRTVPRHGPQGSWLDVDVMDNGPGIHRADWERIFELGFSTRRDGTGLGLSIVRQSVEQIGEGERRGSVGVKESVLNVGTTFSVALPIAPSVGKRSIS